MKGIVEYFGPNKKSYPCGYCKTTKPDNASYGLWAHELTSLQYQDLIDRTWRRSGKYCYKALMAKTCCPPYTIRCDALNFKPSRSQRKTIKRFHEFLAFGIVPKSSKHDCSVNSHSRDDCIVKSISGQVSQAIEIESENERDHKDAQSSSGNSKSQGKVVKKAKTEPTTTPSESAVGNLTSLGGDATVLKDQTRKAKYLRIRKKISKIVKKNDCSEEKAISIMKEERQKKLERLKKTYEDYFNRLMPAEPAHQLEIRFVSTSTDEYQDTFDVTHKLFEKYQMSIHKDEPSDCTPKQFERFLVDNPFEKESFSENSGTIPGAYGSYHMQYWLDGKLIAVGVLDVLPRCLSSVYLFYDPDYNFLNLGTYSALREILLVRELNKINPKIGHYYMGLYIHSCQKMNYKGKFYPSYLLCYQAMTWHPIEKCLPKLDKHPYPRLEENPDVVDEDSKDIKDEDILILYKRRAMNYAVYKLISGTEGTEEIYEYARLVGKKCSKTMLLYRSG